MDSQTIAYFFLAWLCCGLEANRQLYQAKKKGFITHTEDWIIGILLGPVVLICIAMAVLMNKADRLNVNKKYMWLGRHSSFDKACEVMEEAELRLLGYSRKEGYTKKG